MEFVASFSWETVRMLEATAAPSVWLMRYDSRQTVLPLPSTSNQNTARANADRTERVITTSRRPSSPHSTVERTGQQKAADQRLRTWYYFLLSSLWQSRIEIETGKVEKYLYAYVTRCDALIQGLHLYSLSLWQAGSKRRQKGSQNSLRQDWLE